MPGKSALHGVREDGEGSVTPNYVEVGPLMTTRFGEVRWSSSGAGANNLVNADLTALI